MPAPKKYTDELCERAVGLVLEMKKVHRSAPGRVSRVAEQLGINRETSRDWVGQAEVDSGQRPGPSTADAQRIAELERENRALRRATGIVKAAASFFAAELDPPPPG